MRMTASASSGCFASSAATSSRWQKSDCARCSSLAQKAVRNSRGMPATARIACVSRGESAASVTIPVGAERLGDRAFVPGSLDVAVGTTVTWVNTDAVAHTSTSDAEGWSSGIVSPDGQFSSTFQTAGRFPYHCSIHPSMVGTVVVR